MPVNPVYTKQWAAAFYEGTYVETDWQPGGAVVWKAGEEPGAVGVVLTSDPARQSVIAYYDDLNLAPGTEPNFSIQAGPLAQDTIIPGFPYGKRQWN